MSGSLAVSSINGVDISVSPPATQAFANSLLVEYEVIGSPVTSIDFTGLDINKHKSYRVEVECVCTAGADFTVFVNNNTTQANYHTQRSRASGASISALSSNTSLIGTSATGETMKCDASVSRINSLARVNSSMGSAPSASNSNHAKSEHTISSLFTVANITQLTFTSTVAGAFGVGSKIRIYRGDV